MLNLETWSSVGFDFIKSSLIGILSCCFFIYFLIITFNQNIKQGGQVTKILKSKMTFQI